MMNQEELNAAEHLIDLALKEDVATGDLTTDNLIPAELTRKAFWRAKADGVIAGLQVAERTFKKLDANLSWNVLVNDGDKVKKGDLIVVFEGSYRAILTGERTALNFVQRLSGIASMSRIYADAVRDYKCQILDTRKTLPAFRLLDKYAVKTGGASNHRVGLFDMVMIKDNHIDIAGGISAAVQAIRAKVAPDIKIEVETTNLLQVQEAIDAGADIIMLDNMDNATTRQAVDLIAGRAKTEASGNMTLERLAEVAATGVDYISIGALTHSVTALDISQRIEA
ncbi:carboxylating nicotinate-nucleotide diphosphorylase [Mangrovibacterium marinum]|uniref:Probable nicotinate-nucleotide pyrophosphorylase [carboxylating] n=1 Tax=Mangrovibacterium marinum TaxID=1639118 RepID=A0A2T5C233_9BACT|nr:carboxylating nicotinate-nucleotide diphosphorylase [Mangrovibacterium marinum]PTN08721.1 nicotinate-nucleotide pyrophosphorylase [carboxylating] [Mangrovibacterium marinum]